MVKRPRKSVALGPLDPSTPRPEPQTISDVFGAFTAGFRARKFSAGLLVAFIDMFLHLETPTMGFRGWDDFTQRFPPLDTN